MLLIAAFLLITADVTKSIQQVHRELDLPVISADRAINCGSWTPVNIPKGYQGTFTSPGFPSPYPPGTECAFYLTTSIDARLQLKCDSVSIPCTGDAFTVSPSGDLYFKDATPGLCGYGTIAINSTSNGIAVYFRSTYFSGGGTFRCVAQSVAVTSAPTPAPACSCGIKGSNRIVGGTQAGLNEFPWQAMVGDISATGGGDVVCGASVIAPSWVVTAAHCTWGRIAANIAIVAGQYNTQTLGTTSQVRRVVRIVQHPLYNKTAVDNDIALLQLDSPFTYSTAVSPVCLPFKYANRTDDFNGQIGTITGWGTTSFGGISSTTLLKASLPILSTAACKQNANVGSRVTNNMICTYALNKDACQGDSGGPLTWTDPNNGRVYLVGIMSWGIGCAKLDYPGVYTKVTNYLSWIQRNTGESFCSS